MLCISLRRYNAPITLLPGMEREEWRAEIRSNNLVQPRSFRICPIFSAAATTAGSTEHLEVKDQPLSLRQPKEPVRKTVVHPFEALTLRLSPPGVGLVRGCYHFALPDQFSGATSSRSFVSNGGGLERRWQQPSRGSLHWTYGSCIFDLLNPHLSIHRLPDR